MGEDFPLDPNEVSSPQSEHYQAEEEHLEGSEPQIQQREQDSVADPVSAENEGRWDLAKAQTLAPIVQDEFVPQLSEIGRRQRQREQTDQDPNFEDEETHEAHQTWDIWKNHDKYNRSGNISQNSERNMLNQRRYQETKAEQRDRLQGKIDTATQEINADLNSAVSLYEELYDSNPDKFSKMSAGRFMEIARKYVREEDPRLRRKQMKLEGDYSWRFGTDEHLESIKKAVAENQNIESRSITGLAEHYSEALSVTNEDDEDQDDDELEDYDYEDQSTIYLGMMHEIASVLNGPPDKTKGEMMEEFIKIAEGWKARLDERIESDEQKKSNFLKAQGLSSEDNESEHEN